MVVLDKGPSSSSGNTLEVYEEVDEPVTEEELALDAWSPRQAQPYAVHDFSDDKLPDADPSSKPVRYTKAKDTKEKSKEKNAPKVTGVGGKGSSKQHKNRKRPDIPQKPLSLVPDPMDHDFNGAYSELNQKKSYASLEPHTGLNTVARDTVTESYGHLHH